MQYTIEFIEVRDKWLLSIWERAPKTEERLKPFRFQANHFCDSAEECAAILAEYQLVAS